MKKITRSGLFVALVNSAIAVAALGMVMVVILALYLAKELWASCVGLAALVICVSAIIAVTLILGWIGVTYEEAMEKIAASKKLEKSK